MLKSYAVRFFDPSVRFFNQEKPSSIFAAPHICISTKKEDMRYFKVLLIIGLFFVVNNLSAQSVGIGTNTPDSSAILDVSSSTKGLLIPRMNTVQRNAIVTPEEGLMILNLDDKCFDIYDGNSWSKNCGHSIDTLSEPRWNRKNDFGGGGRAYAVGFNIGDKGYIGTGWNGSNVTSDFWEYDPITNTWTQKADLAGGARRYAIGFSIADKGYVGTGRVSSFSSSLSDFWEYDPVTNTWTQKANFGGGARSHAVGFSIGDKGYVGTGTGLSNGFAFISSDFWEYNPSSDSWAPKANFAGGTRDLAVGFSIGDKGYVGTGWNGTNSINGNTTNDLWEYNPTTNSWNQKASFTGEPRQNAVGFSMGSKGYIGTGDNGGYLNDFWEYDPGADSWIQKEALKGAPRSGSVGFSISNKGYVGTGESWGSIGDLWEYNLFPLSLSSNHEESIEQFKELIWTRSGTTIYNTGAIEKVGIGTMTPLNMLDVKGNLSVGSSFSGSSSAPINGAIIEGRVGIGTDAPVTLLHLSQADAVELSIQSTSSGAHRWTIQSNPGTTQFQIIDRTLSHSRLAIDINGHIGLGTVVPKNKLDIRGSLSVGNDFAGNITAPVNGAIIQGRVGIGNGAPQAPLHVTGISSLNDGTNIRYFNSGTTNLTVVNNWQGQTVLLAEGNICATEAFISGASFNFSDARIKRIIGISNGTEDLNRLNEIQVTRYQHIDTIAHGNAIQTKVIAQQLKKVMPEAISFTQNFLPDVMQVAKHLDFDQDQKLLTITLHNTHSLKTGDKVKCLDEKGNQLIEQVLAVPDDYRIQIYPNREVSRLFIYGKQVDDFHIVDYDAIAMLNVSATQELSRMVEFLIEENQKLRAEIEERLNDLEAKMNSANNE